MGLRINQNIAALNAHRSLSVTDGQMSKALEKLSSGFRINRAADDAAGLSVSQGLRAQIGGLKMAARNAQDAISVVQTAEGALTEVHSILQRMRDLSVQASNDGSMDPTARQAAQDEVTQLNAELTWIASKSKFGGLTLLDGTFGVKPATITSGVDADNSYVIAAGDTFAFDPDAGGANAAVTVNLVAGTYSGAAMAAHMESAIKTALTGGTPAQAAYADKVSVTSARVGAGSTLTVNSEVAAAATFTLAAGAGTPLTTLALGGAVTAASGSGGKFQVGAFAGEQVSIAIAAVSTGATSLNTAAIDLVNAAGAGTTILDAAITSVSAQRSTLGAFQNRFEHSINNLNVAVENLSASESRIRDTDMAQELVSLTRSQILSQAGTAMLSQANQSQQSVLSLLR